MSLKTKANGRAGKDRSASRKGKQSRAARRRRERRAIKAQAKQYDSRSVVSDEKAARKQRSETNRRPLAQTVVKPALPDFKLFLEWARKEVTHNAITDALDELTAGYPADDFYPARDRLTKGYEGV